MKKYLMAIISLILGISCFLVYHLIGFSVAVDGTLIEPFGLIPIGFLLTAIALVSGLMVSTWSMFHAPSKTDKNVFNLSLGIFLLASIYLVSSFWSLKQMENRGLHEGEVAVGLTEFEARVIAERSCIKGGHALRAGVYNKETQTWWFDANLNATKPGCSPGCVVNEKTKTAEIQWRCTELQETK
jgi:hypothetical protein